VAGSGVQIIFFVLNEKSRGFAAPPYSQRSVPPLLFPLQLLRIPQHFSATKYTRSRRFALYKTQWTWWSLFTVSPTRFTNQILLFAAPPPVNLPDVSAWPFPYRSPLERFRLNPPRLIHNFVCRFLDEKETFFRNAPPRRACPISFDLPAFFLLSELPCCPTSKAEELI